LEIGAPSRRLPDIYPLLLLAWYAVFLLEIDLKILLRKIGARLIVKIADF
jgi:hypothetical protein